MTDLRSYVALTADLRSGKITPNTYLEESLARIAKRDPEHRRLCGAQQGWRQEGRRSLDRALARRQAAVADRRHAGRDQGHHRDRRHADRPGLADRGRARRRAAIRRRCARCARPAPSSSARPRPPNSPPAIRGTRPRIRTIRRARRAARRAARPPRSAPAWCRPASARRWSARSCGRRASAACVGYKPSVGGDQPQRLARSFQPELRRACSAATLADTWAVMRAITERTGGDPGLRRRHRRRRFPQAARSRSASRSWKPAAGRPPARARARPSRRRRRSSPRRASRSSRARTIRTSTRPRS